VRTAASLGFYLYIYYYHYYDDDAGER